MIYADDLLLLSEIKEGLQSCLDSLQIYSDHWKLKINIVKTKVMIFSSRKYKTENPSFQLNYSSTEIVDKYKYLGIILSNNGNFKHAVDYLYQNSLKAIFALKSNILNYDLINNSLKLKLFDTLVMYGAEIWIGDYTTKQNSLDNLPFEKIHNRSCKYL